MSKPQTTPDAPTRASTYTQGEWVGQPVYLTEPADPNPSPYVYTTKDAHKAGWRDAMRNNRNYETKLIHEAHARGYAEGVQDTLASVRRTAFVAQVYGIDLEAALGL